MTKVPWRSTWRDKGLISAQGFRGFISIMEGKMWWWGGLEEDPPSWLTKKQRENRLELEAAKNLQRPLPTDLLPPTRLCLLKAPGNRHSNHEATETTQIQTVSASHERHPGPTHCILVPFFKALIYNRNSHSVESYENSKRGHTTIHFYPQYNESSLISFPAFWLPAENGNQGYCWLPVLSVLRQRWWRLQSLLNNTDHGDPSAQLCRHREVTGGKWLCKD